MGVLVLLLSGALLGYGVCLLANEGRRDMLANLLLGMLAALTISHLFGPLLGRPELFSGDIPALSWLVSMVGTLVVLGIFNLARMRSAN